MTGQSQDVRTFTVVIARPADIVYGYVSDIANLGQWASAFGPYVRPTGEHKAAASTGDGPVEIEFSPVNSFGIVDHWVAAQDGTRTYVPMRVVRIGDGAAVLITLVRGGASSERWREDCDWVERDLARLKAVLEA